MPRLLFEKMGDSIWISHLDTMRVFQRAFKRAGLHLKHSQGFTPRAIVSIALPLSVGVDSRCELLDYELEQEGTVTPDVLNAVMPAGIRVLEVLEQGRKIRDLTYLRAIIDLEYDRGIPAGAETAMEALFHREELILEKHNRRGTSQVNINPMIRELQIRRPNDNLLELEVLVCAQNPSLNPQLLVNALEQYAPELAPDFSKVHRIEIYDGACEVFR